MLALPVSIAEFGLANSLILLVICWLVMTSGALLVLEVNLRLPAGSNMVSMAKDSFGVPGELLTWVFYLFLLYTLLSAYIAGGSDVFHVLVEGMGLHLSEHISAMLYTLIFGLVVYSGIRSVDYMNRGLMFLKLGIYLLLVLIVSPYVTPTLLKSNGSQVLAGSLMVLVASFGFASIVPSLREYFNDDVSTLRRVIVFGSLIPLFCYVIWDLVITGVVGVEGPEGLKALSHSPHMSSGLIYTLSHVVHNPWISAFFALFSAICMLTAFLGVSLGLFDFLADGLKLEKKGIQGKVTFCLTFLPPLLVVIIKPDIYLQALSYAGICCVMLLLLLPACMAWKSRKLSPRNVQPLVPGGNVVLLFLMVIALALICFNI